MLPLRSLGEEPGSIAPQLRLVGFPFANPVERPADQPLLLQLSIRNVTVEEVRERNTRHDELLEVYKADDAYAELSTEQKLAFMRKNRQEPLPTLTLGGKGSPLHTLPRLELRSGKGAPREVAWRSLVANEEVPPVVTLESDDPLFLFYVLEPDVLRELAQGKSSLVAVVDTSDKSNMWQGKIESQPLDVVLLGAGQGDDRLQRFATGMYLLKDAQYEQALSNAEALTKDYPEYVNAWAQKGDALAGLQRPEEAIEAFSEARRIYNAEVRRNPPLILEPPAYVLRRLEELRALTPPPQES